MKKKLTLFPFFRDHFMQVQSTQSASTEKKPKTSKNIKNNDICKGQ